jgi:predicted TIM-barrel fold metal-dependent hydrolase
VIIDIHNHIGEPWGTRYRQTPEELLRRMDRAAVDLAVVFPFPYGNFSNAYTAQAVERYRDRLVGAVMISPWMRSGIRDELRRHIDGHGFKAVKLHPAAHGYKLSELGVVSEILDACQEFSVPVIVYTGDELYAVPLQVLIAAEHYPDVDFVMTHSGFMMNTNDAVLVARRCPNVHLEHASGISLGVRQSVEAVGPSRVLLGSDTPHMDFEVEIYKIELTVPEATDRALVLGGNAARLLGLGR